MDRTPSAAPLSLDRRGFLKVLGVGGALTVGVPLITPTQALADSVTSITQLGLYLRIDRDGNVTIGVTSAELGQGTGTAIPMLIAEELDVDFATVRTELIPQPLAVDQGRLKSLAFIAGAGGSAAMARSFQPARAVGALARRLLITAAAERWGVPADGLITRDGAVINPATGRSLTYGRLATAAAKLSVPIDPPPVKSPGQFRIIGRPQAQKAGREIVTGKPLFGLDQTLPGMVYAAIVHPPMLGGTVRSLDDALAKAMPGVIAVITLPGPAPDKLFTATTATTAQVVAVIADRYWTAQKACTALKIDWAPGPVAETTDERRARGWQLLRTGEGVQNIRTKGDVATAFAKADKVMEAEYEFPFAAHATMEPLNAIASLADGRLKVIAACQLPASFVNPIFARLAGVEADKVDLIPVRAGGGFGRRLFPDFIAQAVMLTKAVGRPVKVVWTRENDIALDAFRPDGCHRLRAALDAKGNITGWTHALAAQFQLARWMPIPPDKEWSYEIRPDDFPGNLIANQKVDWHRLPSAVTHGAWRAPGHLAGAWAMLGFLDEVAHATGRDSLELQLELLGEPRDLPYEGAESGPVFNTGRMAAVLRLAAEKAGWGAPLPPGRGRGIGGRFAFGTYVAHVVEVTVANGDFTVDRVVSAIDCGLAINPLGIAAQNEGGINDALSAARAQEVTFKDGHLQQSNFHDYEMMRIDRAATRIETHILESTAPPRGMGEPALPAFTPALCNALFAATGKRIRKLPIAGQLAV